MNNQKGSREKVIVWGSLICLAAAVCLQLLARNLNGFATWYASWVYPVLTGTLGRLTGIFPFSVVEVGIYGLAAGCFYCLIRYMRQWKKLLVRALCLVSVLFLMFTLNCGINYYRKPFSDYMNLELRDSSAEELKVLCADLTDKLNDMSGAGITAAIEPRQARKEGVLAMKGLGESYPQMKGFYPRPKALMWSWLFSVQQLCGEYSPFTIEANYNGDMPDYNIPHTICHELSHLRGFMREDEANFIGYLACIRSSSQSYEYSGYLTGWVYATNALAGADMEAYQEICRSLDERVWKDLRENNEYWARYEGRVSEVSNRLNDTYLKMNNQSDGVKSYGRMVDLMLAYAREQHHGGMPPDGSQPVNGNHFSYESLVNIL